MGVAEEVQRQLDMAIASTIDLTKRLVANDEYFKAVATGYRKMYDALMEEGFTEEQTLRLLENYNPSVPR